MTADSLTAALQLAARGTEVFYLGRTKRPVSNCPACTDTNHDRETCGHLTCHGFYAATRNPDRIRAMHTAVPDGMLAIRTGARSRVVVVDIDPAAGGAIDPQLMPPTTAVRTGSGGWHLYYRHPGQPVPNSQGRLGPGVDVRGDGGYVVCPPSINPATGLAYRWTGGHRIVEMPSPLLRRCLPPEPAHCTEISGGKGISSVPALLEANLDAVRRAPEGTRRTTLYGAARGVARMVAAGALTPVDARDALVAVGRSAGQTEREALRAIAGGFQAEGVALCR